MNTIAKVILLSAAVSLPALSGSAYGHQKTDSNSNSMTGGMMMGDMMMMGQKQMTNMREQMQDNQSLMEQIRAEGNDGKRTQLMQQHMKSMNEQMETMHEMMGDDQGSMSSTEMPEHMQMMNIMNSRMGMMQMMMKQMMEHQAEDQDLDEHHDD